MDGERKENGVGSRDAHGFMQGLDRAGAILIGPGFNGPCDHEQREQSIVGQTSGLCHGAKGQLDDRDKAAGQGEAGGSGSNVAGTCECETAKERRQPSDEQRRHQETLIEPWYGLALWAIEGQLEPPTLLTACQQRAATGSGV